MRSTNVVPLLAVGLILASALAGAMQTSGTVTLDRAQAAGEKLEKCRRDGRETLELARCHEEAVMAWPQNYSWWSSLALLYIRADLNEQAQEAMNKSVAYWLDAMKPHFARGNLNVTDGKTRWVDALRFVYDDEGRPEEERRAEAVEMGLLLAKKFEVEHLPSDAHSVYYEFLLQTGSGQSQVIDFHRRTGNILGMVLSPSNDSSTLWRIAESIQPVIDGFTEHLGTKGPGPFAEPIKRMCGIEYSDNAEIKASELVADMERCIIDRWGNLTQSMDEEPDDAMQNSASSMRETAFHKLAMAGATRTLKAALQHMEGRQIVGDRFGRGTMHYAAAWGRKETLDMLIELGGDVDAQDRGQVKPRHLACASHGFRKTFIEMMGGSEDEVCAKHDRDKYIDEDAESLDDTASVDGGWNPRYKRTYLHCDFDVRDASKMTQSDLMIMYTSSNHPVVLRNSFYEEDGPNSKWKLKRFNKTFGDIYVRNEFYPRQSRWGLAGRANVSKISDFLAELSVDDKKVATLNVDHVKHPMADLVDQWVPPTFSNKKTANEIDFYDPLVTVPTLNIFKKGSRGHHYVRAQGMYHTVVYGLQEWKLLPPRHARSLRGPLPKELDAFALRCDIAAGDVLIVPDMWSASWTAKNNGVSHERFLYKTPRTGRSRQQQQQQDKDTTGEL